jgi:uncharacterized phage protein (TIGR02218 family)
VPRAAHQATATAAGGTATRVQWASGRPAGWYDQGVVAFTGGRNIGARRTIKASDAAGLTLAQPLPHAVEAGDAFTAVPGCPKTYDICKAKFNNLDSFRGFPWVPPPETAR